MRRFCRIQLVQMHLPHLPRPMSSIQSAYHHQLMHDAHHNWLIPDTKWGERWSAPYLRCSPRTVIETWGLECIFYKKHSGCCDKAKALCILCTGSVVRIHQTLYGHIRTTSSCRLLFVLRTDMSMLLDSVIQHGVDGVHSQWFTLPYTMLLSRLAQWQWNICFPSASCMCRWCLTVTIMPIRLAMWQWKICFSTANQTAITEKVRGHAANWTHMWNTLQARPIISHD